MQHPEHTRRRRRSAARYGFSSTLHCLVVAGTAFLAGFYLAWMQVSFVNIAAERAVADMIPTRYFSAKSKQAIQIELEDPNDNSTAAPTYNWLMESKMFPECTKLEPSEIDYTLVTQGSDERFWLMEEICQRWKGPISIALYTSSSHSQVMELLVNAMGCSRDMISLAIVSTEDYPIQLFPFNVLRNRAIELTTTTHFVMLDMDFVPSADLYDLLHSPDVLNKFTKDTKAAIVIPAFDMFKPNECYEYPDHCQHLGCYGVKDTPNESCSAEANKVPRNKTELDANKLVRPCNFFDIRGNRNFPKGQASTDYSQWNSTEPGKIYNVPCVQTVDYEPYIAVRRCRTLPPFQEGFLGYGRDKSSWFVQLRLMDYAFLPLGGAFCVHYPHSRGLNRMHVHAVNLVQKRNHMFDNLAEVLEDDPNIHSRSPTCTDEDIENLSQDFFPRPVVIPGLHDVNVTGDSALNATTPNKEEEDTPYEAKTLVEAKD